MYRNENQPPRKICTIANQSSSWDTIQIILSASDIDPVELSEIKNYQANQSFFLKEAKKDLDGILKIRSKIWIPPDVLEMKLKIMIGSHCGTAGHRRSDSTKIA